jgi:amidase
MAYPRLTDKPGALETAAAIRAGELSPREAVGHAIARIEKLDAKVNAVVVCDFDRAREVASALDGRTPRDDQPLFGVPMTIKESFDIAGLPTSWGHQRYAGNIASRDAEVVQRLKRAGAIFLGKTNIPPDLADWQSSNPVYGRTSNPHDPARSPGGSSGGAAAAVASGMVACEFGSDIGGSIRVPAHFCGIWGHKTSWGLISLRGHYHPALSASPGFPGAHDGALGVVGPLARNPDDLEALVRITTERPLGSRGKPLRECRLLLLTDHPASPIDASVREPIEAAASELERAGVRIDRSSDLVPDLARQHAAYMKMLAIAMARGAPAPDGKRASASDWFGLLDAQAVNAAAWAALFETYDFVLAPPAPTLAFEHRDGPYFWGAETIDGANRRAADGLAWAGLATFPNLPATVLPVGESGGLPCGMQVIGPAWADLDCIAAARGIGRILHG